MNKIIQSLLNISWPPLFSDFCRAYPVTYALANPTTDRSERSATRLPQRIPFVHKAHFEARWRAFESHWGRHLPRHRQHQRHRQITDCVVAPPRYQEMKRPES